MVKQVGVELECCASSALSCYLQRVHCLLVSLRSTVPLLPGPPTSTSDPDGIRYVAMPTAVPGLGTVRVVSVSCGSRHTLALDAAVSTRHGGCCTLPPLNTSSRLHAVVWWCLLQHVAYSWGWGLCGQLGHGEFVQAQPTPRQITALSAGGDDSLADGVIAISAGGIHSAAVDLKGKAGGEAAGGLMCVGR